jgi:hypothetical protein
MQLFMHYKILVRYVLKADEGAERMVCARMLSLFGPFVSLSAIARYTSS